MTTVSIKYLYKRREIHPPETNHAKSSQNYFKNLLLPSYNEKYQINTFKLKYPTEAVIRINADYYLKPQVTR